MAYSSLEGTYYGASPPKSPPRTPRRSSSLKDARTVEEDDVVQGRLFWLPPKNELPERAVRRAHGKGAVEEGIYNHPIVVVSKPVEETSIVHFHLITSFQGKKLHEIYGKNNEFHASRRSWYLPVAPTPDHPDANSKKSKKRFPTLDLAGGAVLRWDSYVNLRHVYKVDWRHLRPYANPDTPYNSVYRIERESMVRLLAKGKVLTTYEPGPQSQRRPPRVQIPSPETQISQLQSPTSDTASIISSEYSSPSAPLHSDFLGSKYDAPESTRPPFKVPPDRDIDGGRLETIRWIFHFILGWPLWVVEKVCEWLRG
ncbi:hypothetical protein BDV95DRAFT_491727 [Massariosphaeria phaeospora]|uniref:Uncharacterized protein n=1 Tax=Massariosphaeria phaeospora TaxID=100035 RepID=A0A7C8IBT9_9PLEO|nr:hypothetical protein BDV95DRAFT_491727 [Massariosphaeria phaeospora]